MYKEPVEIKKHGKWFKWSVITIIGWVLLSGIFYPVIMPRDSYQDYLEVAEKIVDSYPIDEIAVYSNFGSANEIVWGVLGPEGIHFRLYELVNEKPQQYLPYAKHTFIIIDKDFHPSVSDEVVSSTMSSGVSYSVRPKVINEEAKEWISIYMESHDNMRIFTETNHLIVYEISVE